MELRGRAVKAAGDDSHAYCGLLAAAIFDTAGRLEDKESHQLRRNAWMQRYDLGSRKAYGWFNLVKGQGHTILIT